LYINLILGVAVQLKIYEIVAHVLKHLIRCFKFELYNYDYQTNNVKIVYNKHHQSSLFTGRGNTGRIVKYTKETHQTLRVGSLFMYICHELCWRAFI